MTLQTTAKNSQSNLLRRTFQANGLFSSLSGIVLIAGAKPVASFLGLDVPLILVGVGVVCLLYGASLFFSATQGSIASGFAWFTVVADTTWVLGSLVILLTGWPGLTPAGWWAVAIVADIVAVFAAVQFYGLRQMSKQ